jgi:hypothetical protein
MGFAVIHRLKAIILGVTQKARWDGVTLVAGIVVDVMIHACASTCRIVKTETQLTSVQINMFTKIQRLLVHKEGVKQKIK